MSFHTAPLVRTLGGVDVYKIGRDADLVRRQRYLVKPFSFR